MKKVRFMNLSIEKEDAKDYKNQFEKLLSNGMFIMGEEVKKFENEISTFIDVKYSLGVSSGTDALILALKCLDIGLNDEVIIPDMSFIATANAVAMVNAKPVFCDVEDDFNIKTKKIQKLITKNTKAIIVVHYGGKMANMEELLSIAKKYNLKVIEDASQAFGATYKGKSAGTLGDIGCFSLNPMKPLGALGEAGLITTNSKKFYKKINMLRYNGLNEEKKCIYKSHNCKIDTMQAAFLSLKLKKFKKTIKRREEIFNYYNKELKKIVLVPTVDKYKKDVYFTYTILVDIYYRDKLYNYLAKYNIEAKIYHTSMHKEPAYKNLQYKNLENSIKLSKMKLALPCHEKLKRKELEYIVSTIKGFYETM